MTDHPCHYLSQAARDAFERIAIGLQPGANPRTIELLLRHELIERAGMKVLGRDAFGPFEVPVYEIPLSKHFQWCRWCDESVKDPDHTD